MPSAKLKEQKKARELRVQGESIPVIAQILNVSKGSVSTWVKDIDLTDEQKQAIQVKYFQEARHKGADSRRRHFLGLREQYQSDGRLKVRSLEPLYISGIMLYWAEGSKNMNSVKLSNSDPNLIRHFIKFVQDYYPEQYENINLSVRWYTNNGLSEAEVRTHWEEVCYPAPLKNLRLYEIKPEATRGLKVGKLPYGTVDLAIHSVQMLQEIYGAIQEYCDFDCPEWLEKPRA